LAFHNGWRRSPIGQQDVYRSLKDQSSKKGKQELEWIDKKEDKEKEHRVKDNDIGVLQSVSTEEFELIVPDEDQDRESESERDETAHGEEQFMERQRDFKRNHKEGDREREHGITKPLNPKDLFSSPSKAGFRFCHPTHQRFTNHSRLQNI
jgi:hypothetical protein